MSAAFGVYVHIPFCESRCDYCDFATWTDRAHLVEAYIDACVRDIERRDLPEATSVFFGGGTPSLLAPHDLARVLDAVPTACDAEVTVECNPDSVDGPKLRGYASAGVNRVSIGVQSLRVEVLAALGRTHDPANVARAVDAVFAAGIERLNLDLIYGTPGERVADWEHTLRAALALGPTHVSAYALTVESGTPLGRQVAAGVRPAPDDDDQATKYELADDVLAAAGFDWYEISNWCRPRDECRHNLLTWAQGDYAGIGCSAHGHRQGRRSWNLRTPERYVAAVADGGGVEAGHEELTGAERAAEALTLGLRTRRGLQIVRPDADDSGVDPLHATIESLSDDGLVTRRGGCVVLTRRGRLLASDVTARCLRSLDARPATVAGTR